MVQNLLPRWVSIFEIARALMHVWVPSYFSHVPWLCPVARQAPLSMGFSRQECWCGLPCPPPGDPPDPGIEPVSLMSAALAGRFFATRAIWEAYCTILYNIQIVQYYRQEIYLGTIHQPYWNFFAVFSAFICEFVFCAIYCMSTTTVEIESNSITGIPCATLYLQPLPFPPHS